VYNLILKHCYVNVLIWKGSSYTFWFKILVSAVGGMKNFFTNKMYTYLVEMISSFSSLCGHCKGGFSDTKFQEVDIELRRPK